MRKSKILDLVGESRSLGIYTFVAVCILVLSCIPVLLLPG